MRRRLHAFLARPLGLLAALLLLGPTGCLTVNFPGVGDGALVESTLYGEGEAKIVLVDVEGTLSERPEEPGPLVTVDFVLAETDHLVLMRLGRRDTLLGQSAGRDQAVLRPPPAPEHRT